MALLEEQFTETLDAGAPDITYQGNEGKEQKIARQLWDQLPNEVRMQFGSFQQFFSSGAWKEVLARLQQAQEQTPERIQETETIEEQPQQGLASMMPAQMAGGGNVQLASHESNDAFLEQRMEYYLEQGFSPRKAAEQAQKDLMEGNYQDMADGGRPGYFLGKLVKKITKPIKKIVKSPIGKAAAIAGLGSWGLGMGPLGNLAGAGWMKGPMMKKLLLKAPAEGKTVADLSWGLGNLSPLKVLGAGATVAPFAMQAMGKWDTGAEEIDDLKLKAAEFGFDYSQMIQDLQTAVATGSEAELAKVLSQYNLSRGDMSAAPYIGTTAAEGGRIGYKDGGIYETALMDAWRTYQAQGGTLSLEEFADGWMKAMMEGKAQGGRIGAQEGGLMSLGGMEMDLRGGGFVPIGKVEKADDVPARLSKNEFVFTADAVRAAGNGDVDAGADKMYNTMKQLESRVG